MLNGKVDSTTIYVADCRRKVLYGPYFVVNVKDIPLGVLCFMFYVQTANVICGVKNGHTAVSAFCRIRDCEIKRIAKG